jgi:5-methylcytosine-specific restriction endonuclease McrA
MQRYSLGHLADSTLSNALDTVIAHHCASTADVLAHIAEFDARQLYLPAGYPSMYTYCVGQLHLCEQAGFKRIRAARAARRFPEIFSAVAEGRLHLTAVVLLVPYLTEDNAEELLSAATHRSKAQIEQLLVERFPRPDVLAWVAAVPAPSAPSSAAEPVSGQEAKERSPGTVDVYQNSEAAPVAAPAPHASDGAVSRPRVQPLSPQSYAVQFTMSRSAHEKLRYAQELLSHQVPSGDLAQVFERALEALIPQLEKRRFAATSRPRPVGERPSIGRPSTNSRRIPAHVKRAVWRRDGGRCTFVSASGHRCPARTRLEFDHIHEFGRGGQAMVSGIRLRCRAHNQYEAERTYGREFMRQKRLAAADARTIAKTGASAGRVRATGAEQDVAAARAVADAPSAGG